MFYAVPVSATNNRSIRTAKDLQSNKPLIVQLVKFTVGYFAVIQAITLECWVSDNVNLGVIAR